MKLESYPDFLKEFFWCSASYILVVPAGYILLISICPMLKAGEMQSIASSAILANLFKNYFKGAKIWWLFAHLYWNFIVLCWKSQQSTLWIDFKVESVLQSRRKK